MRRIIKKLLLKKDFNLHKTSFSQYGEDQILLSLIYLLNMEKVNFLDIGANHPFALNNTILLSLNGHNGINVEPDPSNFTLLQKHRTRDINLNIGVSDQNSILDYYRFSDSVYNTFSEDEYKNLLEKSELSFLEVLKIDVLSYDRIVEKYLDAIPPTILLIDTEGQDETIIKAIDFSLYAPSILVVETFAYGRFEKDLNLIELIKGKGYSIHADTFVNTIFVKNTLLPFARK